ncbi:MAG: pyruvate kinase [Chloroflexi bacterium]|nr:pyruvate kinase [Chloroflexota bacterium]
MNAGGPPPPRRTKIIATTGPASRSESVTRSLIDAGVDAFRLNFSYGSHDKHTQAFELIRRLSHESGRPVAIVQDLQGPKIRVGKLVDGPLRLETGDETVLTTDSVTGDAAHVPVQYAALPRVVVAGDRILLGDGEVELRVTSATGSEVRAIVIEGGALKENQGVHLPGAALSEEAITEKDLADLRLGVGLGVDYIALSFVRSGDDVRRLKQLIREQGARIPVIAKLEKREAIEALGDILAVADGVMIARGDLGLELGPEKVPLLQKRIIQQANERGILVITATQMLESMVDSSRPTRAEASDVANAILDGTDAVMLSAETAVGRYPTQAVRMMGRIAEEAEQGAAGGHADQRRMSHAHAMSRAACELASDVHASAIVVFTRSGYSAYLVSKERPRVPIFAFTPSEAVSRQLALWWGVTPLLAEFTRSVEKMIPRTDRYLVEQGLLQKGDIIVVARWSPLRARGWTNFIQLYRLATERP